MKNMINQVHLEGLIYEHDLELKVSGPNAKNPNTEFITGTLSIATDDARINVIPVHFTYVTATTSKGKPNETFNILKNIIDEKLCSVMKHGLDKAGKVRIDTAIGLNEFYTDRDGEEVLVSSKRNEGGFIHLCSALADDEKDRNTFACDMVITGATRIEANPEKQLPEKVIVKGAIFDFRKSLLPVEFSATNPGAMDYFEGLGASGKEPVFTKVWGRQVSETVVRKVTEESAFGEDSVREFKSTRKDFLITGALKEPYIWDTDETITADELVKCMTDRETTLATIKQRREEYKASKSNPVAAAPAAGGFNF